MEWIRLLHSANAVIAWFMLGKVLLLVTALLFCLGLFAEGAELEIAKVEFNLVDQAGVRDPWYEVAISVSVRRGDQEAGSNPRFANDVGVALTLATEAQLGSESNYVFYRAKVEYPTLEVGMSVVRFYLPPEVAKRDRIKGEPFAFEVEVFSNGKASAVLRSRNLDAANVLESFHAKAEAEAVVDVLRLQDESPFWLLKSSDAPNPRLRLR